MRFILSSTYDDCYDAPSIYFIEAENMKEAVKKFFKKASIYAGGEEEDTSYNDPEELQECLSEAERHSDKLEWFFSEELRRLTIIAENEISSFC